MSTLTQVNGMEVCSVSGLCIGQTIESVDNELDENAVSRRHVFIDPLNMTGSVDKETEVLSVFKLLFGNMFLTQEQLTDKHRAALIAAKKDGLDIKAKAREITTTVNNTYVTMHDLKQLTDRLVQMSAWFSIDYDFQSFVLGYLHYANNEGLMYNNKQLIEPNEKLRRFCPHERHFLGIKSSSVTIGVNLIISNLDAFEPYVANVRPVNKISLTKRVRRVQF
jgi:hypothetical protein